MRFGRSLVQKKTATLSEWESMTCGNSGDGSIAEVTGTISGTLRSESGFP
jgi:hypothetical protein